MHRVCCWLLFFEETYFIYQYRDLIPTNIMLRGPSCSSLIALSSVIDLTIYLVFTYKISSAKENSVKILTAITISKGYLWTLRGDTYSWTIFTDSQNNKTYKDFKILQKLWSLTTTCILSGLSLWLSFISKIVESQIRKCATVDFVVNLKQTPFREFLLALNKN